MSTRRLLPILSLLACALGWAQPGTESVLLDGFEDTSLWFKGDSNTDMDQQEVGYGASTEFIKEGRQSLAFMVRVDWSEKPGVQYAKGWPMLKRNFPEPQDWSSYDRIECWVYPQTEALLPVPKALRCGFGLPDGKVEEWIDIVLKKNVWNRVSIRLAEKRDWTKVTGVWFYIAEAWYQDGDRVNFYLDDLRLVRLTEPRILSASASACTNPRGTKLDLSLALEGPSGSGKLRAKIMTGDTCEKTWEGAVTGKRGEYQIPLQGVAPGGHTLVTELLAGDGRVLDSRSQFFRSMQPGKRTYLSLITFYTPHIMDA